MTLQPYAKYTTSGVDWISDVPSHWEAKRLKNVVTLLTDKAEHRHRTVALENIESSTGRFLPTETEFGGAGTAFAKGDLLFGKLRPYLAKVWLADSPGEAVGDFHVFRPLSNVCGRYLLHQMLHHGFVSTVDGSTYGAKMPRADWDFMANMVIAVPPPKEQASIALFLDSETAKIDTLVAEQRRLIGLLKEKRQAVISHAVTKGLNPNAPMKPSGVPWLGDVPEHWTVGPLKRFWSVTDCKHVTAEFVDCGIPLASIREVQSKWVQLQDAKQTTRTYFDLLIEGDRKPLVGDLLFSRNATVGEVAQVGEQTPEFAMGQDVCLLRKRHHDASSDYLQYLLKSNVLAEQIALLMVGATFKRINVDEIRNLIAVSPPADEQREIAEFINRQACEFDALIADVEHASRLLQERRTALISAAVTGKIDVREFAFRETA